MLGTEKSNCPISLLCDHRRGRPLALAQSPSIAAAAADAAAAVAVAVDVAVAVAVVSPFNPTSPPQALA